MSDRSVAVLLRPKTPIELTEAWIETYTGKKFHLLEPQEDEVNILDIAHALANQCRFGGHTMEFLSIAEHSVMVSKLTKSLEGLLHDATEAYISDVVSPLKHSLPEYKAVEKRIAAVIARKFKLPFPSSPIVKEADIAQLKSEAYYGLISGGKLWADGWETSMRGLKPQFWGPKKAEREFLKRYEELSK